MSQMAKPQTYCSLNVLAENEFPKYHRALGQNCLLTLLRPQGKEGITIIVYDDKKEMDKFAQSAYGKDSDIFVKMARASTINRYLESPQDFQAGQLINRLGKALVVKEVSKDAVVLENGTKLVKKEFKFSRPNMAVYAIKGKGSVPITGADIQRPVKPAAKTGGGSEYSALIEYLCSTFKGELEKSNNLRPQNNVFVRKVAAHLTHLKNCNKTMAEIGCYLGNDEISDSFLLDAYCRDHCDGCFGDVLAALKSAELDTVERTCYQRIKTAFIGQENGNYSDDRMAVRNGINFRDIKSASGTRAGACEIYRKKYGDAGMTSMMGRDLFIVVSNIMRDAWQSANNAREAASKFDDFANDVVPAYTRFEISCNGNADAHKDLSLYGMLIKSDVLLFYPQADFSKAQYGTSQVLPPPKELRRFSLCRYINTFPATGGAGESEAVRKILDGVRACGSQLPAAGEGVSSPAGEAASSPAGEGAPRPDNVG